MVNPPDVQRGAANALQAIVFSEIFKPLAKELGPVGDVAVADVAQHLFVATQS